MTLILLLLPVFAALVLLLLKGETVKIAALFFAIAELVVAGIMVAGFHADASYQYVIDYLWIADLGIHFKAGVDGISLVMVVLTTLLVPLIILSTFKHQYNKPSTFYALILFMQTGLLLVFTAMDAFLFYVGWEVALIPIYFICALWGGENRIKVTIKFFIYTFAGSLFMLLGIIYLYLQTPDKTFDIQAFYNLNFDPYHQGWIFWAFFIAFAIKMPIFPFHTWQPDTYTTAPTGGTMMLSGIMLKMGIYGAIRWLIPIAPLGFAHWQSTVIILAVIGIVYASLIAFNQKDAKRLIAYSSIAHVGLIAAGIFAWNMQGVQGAVFQMLSHGINVIGLFFVIDIISRRINTRDISLMGGIAKSAPFLATSFIIIIMGTVALPLTNGFIGEFLLMNGIYQYNIWLVAIAGLTIIFGAVYMLRMYKQMMQGETSSLTASFTDVSGSEKIVLVIICALVIVLGVYPQMVTHLSEASVNNLIEQVNQKLISAK
ncbi:complex I subunit 4 family protein [Mucilaginibacter arboris]|uniref:NADH-quinone oxidoreductase subunit M n=1 Tax=Mucilaginibacter arboris TaxID=2682090 RepID=A0A7K1SRW6_9SPHI|nr:NADH-quinone oxidoreductase subunit M [Mucilaginibacter arboris]MVN20059.1 NADH-quinone oxidoreductase subunit M [Mucilaginibacter arboris]